MIFTIEEVRAAALTSLELAEAELGTAVLTIEARTTDGTKWAVIYGDSGGTFEGTATVWDGPQGEYLLVAWDES